MQRDKITKEEFLSALSILTDEPINGGYIQKWRQRYKSQPYKSNFLYQKLTLKTATENLTTEQRMAEAESLWAVIPSSQELSDQERINRLKAACDRAMEEMDMVLTELDALL
jgi:hypothetical protein